MCFSKTDPILLTTISFGILQSNLKANCDNFPTKRNLVEIFQKRNFPTKEIVVGIFPQVDFVLEIFQQIDCVWEFFN